MFEVADLTGGWGQTTVVEGVSLALKPGETVAIIGRNGVGKTTLLEILTGRAQRLAGRIMLDGRDISLLPTYQRAGAGLGYVPQEREVFPSLTVRENLRVARRPGRWDEETLFAIFPALKSRLNSLGGQLSGGEQQMLSIARALIGNPKMLLMDEPSEGLAPVVVEQVMGAVGRVAGEGALTILIVEQRVDIVLELADRCFIMDRGRLVHEEASDTLRRDADRLSSLIGLS